MITSTIIIMSIQIVITMITKLMIIVMIIMRFLTAYQKRGLLSTLLQEEACKFYSVKRQGGFLVGRDMGKWEALFSNIKVLNCFVLLCFYLVGFLKISCDSLYHEN